MIVIEHRDRHTAALQSGLKEVIDCSYYLCVAFNKLAAVPGLGVDSAQQIIAEVGASAAVFPSAKKPHLGWAPARAMRRVRE